MNNFSHLLDLATQISQALQTKTDLSIRLGKQRRDLEARQLAMIPTDKDGKRGWPGSNAEAREVNEKLAYANDPPCKTIQDTINQLEEALALAETGLEGLVAERRALEWMIRAQRLEMRRLEFGLLDQPDTVGITNSNDFDGLDDQEDDLFDDNEFTGSPIADEEEIPF